MIDLLQATEWATAALVAFGAALAALRWLKAPPIWAVVVAIVAFAGLTFPVKTHAIKLDMPPPSSN